MTCHVVSTALLLLLGVTACSHQSTTTADGPKAGTTTNPSGTHATGPARYSVRHYTGAQDKPTEKIGVVSFGAHDTLVVDSADDGPLGSKLREAVARLNEAESLTRTGEPVGDSALITRGQPGFIDAEREQLRRLYGFELVR